MCVVAWAGAPPSRDQRNKSTVRDVKKRESERRSRDLMRADDGNESDGEGRGRPAFDSRGNLFEQLPASFFKFCLLMFF